MHGSNGMKKRHQGRAAIPFAEFAGGEGPLLGRAAPPVVETPTRSTVTKTVIVHPTTTPRVTTPVVVPPPKVSIPKVVTTPSVTVPVVTPVTKPTTTPSPTTTPPTTTPSTSPSTTPTTTPSSTDRALTTPSLTPSMSSPSATPGTDSASNSASTTQKTGGLSGAATGGIVAACVLVALALLIFAIRKTFIQRRKRRRNTWGAGTYPAYTDKVDPLELPPPTPEKRLSPSFGSGPLPPPSPRTPVWAPPRPESVVRAPSSMGNVPPAPGMKPSSNLNPNSVSPPPQNNFYVTPPPMSYNNPIVDDVYGGISTAPSQGSIGPAAGMGVMGMGMAGAGANRTSMAGAKETAVVRVVYIPTLPDELSITAGEVVHVLKAFDDGWALCANVRGEQGVVPVECLDRSAHLQMSMQQQTMYGSSPSGGYGSGQETGGDWRNMKRLSSLSTQQPHY